MYLHFGDKLQLFMNDLCQEAGRFLPLVSAPHLQRLIFIRPVCCGGLRLSPAALSGFFDSIESLEIGSVTFVRSSPEKIFFARPRNLPRLLTEMRDTVEFDGVAVPEYTFANMIHKRKTLAIPVRGVILTDM